MSRLLKVTEPAEKDLEKIWLDLEPFGVALADRRLAKIQAKFALLQQFPGLGRSREDLSPGLRSVSVEGLVVLYRALEGLLLIVRVAPGNRDLKRLFNDSED
jgi:toxin ParE1/3/4